MESTEHHLRILARLEPGDPPPAATAVWLRDGARLYVDAGGDLSLDRCFGLRRDDTPTSARARRDYYLTRAFTFFEPQRHRLNTNRMGQFAECVQAFAKEYRHIERAGGIPREALRRMLYLAFGAGVRVPTSEKQLRRIITRT